MSNTTFEDQLAQAGISYGRRHDTAYRAGLVLQALGLAVLAVLYPLENPFYSAGIMLFDLGALVSGIFLLVWISWIRKLILGAVLIGIPVQVLGMLAVPPEHAGLVIIAGIGLVCAGAAGMAGKEAYCFAYREGWALMWLFPFTVLVNLLGKESTVINALSFSALFLLLLSLVGKKLKQPLLAQCAADKCGTPRQQTTDDQTTD